MVMASVAEMVRKKKENQQKRIDEYERKEKARNKRLNSQEFSEQITDIINRFEHRVFSLKSTKKKVVEFIVDYDGSRNLSWDDDFFHAIKFYNGDRDGRTSIKMSKRFKEWKEALEKKFGIEIDIRRSYVSKRRFDSDGFETYPDEIYQGLKATVTARE